MWNWWVALEMAFPENDRPSIDELGGQKTRDKSFILSIGDFLLQKALIKSYQLESGYF